LHLDVVGPFNTIYIKSDPPQRSHEWWLSFLIVFF
jgi:hypothetical protein